MFNYSLLADWENPNPACDSPAPRAFDTSLTLCTIISVPAYLVVFLSFVKKSHESFKLYKRRLMCSVVSNMCLEFSITILVRPVAYFPEIAVRVGGIGFLRHSTGALSFVIVCVAEIANAYCLLALFNYRMNVLVDPWKCMYDLKILKVIRVLQITMYSSFILSLLSVYFIFQVFLDQPFTKSRASTLSSLPEFSCLSFILVPTLSHSQSGWIQLQLFNLLIVIPNFLMFSLGLLMSYTILQFLAFLKKEAHVSAFFLNFHKLYLRNILLQLMIHVFFLGVPSICYSGAAIYNLGDSVFTLFSIIVLSLHGPVLSILIIWMNKPLRHNLFSLCFKNPQTNPILGKLPNSSRTIS